MSTNSLPFFPFLPAWPFAAALFVALTGTAFAQPTATHQSVQSYAPGTTISVTNSITYSGTVLSLLCRPQMPSGWTVGSVSGDGNPEFLAGEILWTGAIPSSPVDFVISVHIPANAAGTQGVRNEVEYQTIGMANPASVFAAPDPLSISGPGAPPPETPVIAHSTAVSYTPGSTVLVTNSVSYTGTLLSLLCRPQLPSGWSIVSVSGDGSPEAFGGEILWTGSMPASPVDFVYTVSVPGGATGTKSIRDEIEYQFSGMANPTAAFAAPDPLQISAAVAPPPPVTVTHSGNAGYTPGGTYLVTNSFSYTGTLLSLLWRPQLPSGWSLIGASGDGSVERVGGEILWTGALPASPVDLVYTVQVPAGQSGVKSIRGEVEYQFTGMVNPGGIFASPDPLSILDQGLAPAISMPPASQSVIAGASAAFSVNASGTPPLAYQWFFNGTLRPGATSQSLNLATVGLADAGNYAVRVSNAYGSITSAVAVLAVTVPVEPGEPPSLAREDFWIPDAPVRAVVETNGVVYLGGDFTYIGPNTGSGVVFENSLGEPARGFPKINGEVKAVIPDGAGGWIVGGSFTLAGGLVRSNLVRVRADWIVDPSWTAHTDGGVRALARDGNTLYVGGQFNHIGGVLRSNLALVSLGTGLPSNQTLHTDGIVHALVPNGGLLYVGGEFLNIDGRSRKRLAAILLADAEPTAWKPEPNAAVFALAIGQGVVYAGGEFYSIGGVSRARIAALDPGTGSPTSWVPEADNAVRALVFEGGKVYAGGAFTTIGRANRPFLACIDPSGTGDATSWNPAPDSTVWTMLAANGSLYVGGQFDALKGEPRRRLGRFELATGNLTAWNPGASDRVFALASSGTSVFVGGRFNSVGGTGRRFIAALDAASGAATEWNPSADRAVYALALGGNTLYAGGQFTAIGGQARQYIAGIDLFSGAATSFAPEPDDFVSALRVSGELLYAGGVFGNVQGEPRERLAAIQLANGQPTPWNPRANNAVFALAVDGDTIYAGGDFHQIGGIARNRIAAINRYTGSPTDWNPNADQRVTALAVHESRIFAGGFFGQIGGQPRARLAAIDLLGDATAWQPGILNTNNGSSAIQALSIFANALYAGGLFNQAAGQPRSGLAGLDLATAAATSWNPSCHGEVLALSANGDRLYAGGAFTTVGGKTRPYFVAFMVPGLPIIVSQPRSLTVATGSTNVLSVGAIGREPLAFQWRFEGTNLPGMTLPQLNLDNVQETHSGRYQVVVSNVIGQTISVEAVLRVLSLPSIVSHPVSQQVGPGSTVTFSVNATGSEPLAFQWRKNGVPLLGETNPTLTLFNVAGADAGSFRVSVANAVGVVESDPATLEVLVSSSYVLSDMFANRQLMLNQPAGTVRGNNLNATRELNEPNHAGKPGGRSMWISWRAPANGIATFNTIGSSFDTLLAVYQGSEVGTLQSIASDEDDGGFFASIIAFNAVAGADYHLAVDGFGGGAGNIILNWNFEETPEDVPRIITHPRHYTVGTNHSVILTVAAESAKPLTYQWYFNDAPLSGKTGPTLNLPEIKVHHVGLYSVRVNNPTRSVRSRPAVIEIGPQARAITKDKLQDITQSVEEGPGAPETRAALNSASVVIGTLGTQVLDNFGASHEFCEPNHGGVIGGASRWFRLDFETNGWLIVDTMGSDLDTVMALYTGVTICDLTSEGSDDNGAPDGVRSWLRLPVVRGEYLVAVDGVNGVVGNIKLNWRFGTLPVFDLHPSPCTALIGESCTLTAAASCIPAASYQWRKDGVIIPGATGPTLTLVNLKVEDSGAYSVIADNLVGSQTSIAAELLVIDPNFDRRAGVAAGTAGGAPGGQLQLPLFLAAHGIENEAAFSVGFDPVLLEYVGAALGAGANGATLTVDNSVASAGQIGLRIRWPGVQTFSQGTQQVATLTFRIAQTAQPGLVLDFAMNDVPTVRQVADASGNPLPCIWMPGTREVTAGLEGDAAPRPSGDGTLTVADWVMIGRFAAALEYPAAGSELQRADCAPAGNLGDGSITVADWVQAGRYAAGLDAAVPAGGPGGP